MQAEFLCNEAAALPVISRIEEPVSCAYVISLLWNGACSSDSRAAAALKTEVDVAAPAHIAAAASLLDDGYQTTSQAFSSEVGAPQALARDATASASASIAEEGSVASTAHVPAQSLPADSAAAAGDDLSAIAAAGGADKVNEAVDAAA